MIAQSSGVYNGNTLNNIMNDEVQIENEDEWEVVDEGVRGWKGTRRRKMHAIRWKRWIKNRIILGGK